MLNGVYGGSKAFVMAFSQSLHHELAAQGLRVQAVLPGATATTSGPRVGLRGPAQDDVGPVVAQHASTALCGLTPRKELIMKNKALSTYPWRSQRLSDSGPSSPVRPAGRRPRSHRWTHAHTGYEVSSNGQSLLIVGDAVHVGQVQFERPDIGVVFDGDGAAADKSRAALFEEAARTDSLIGGQHLPFRRWGDSARKVPGMCGCLSRSLARLERRKTAARGPAKVRIGSIRPTRYRSPSRSTLRCHPPEAARG